MKLSSGAESSKSVTGNKSETILRGIFTSRTVAEEVPQETAGAAVDVEGPSPGGSTGTTSSGGTTGPDPGGGPVALRTVGSEEAGGGRTGVISMNSKSRSLQNWRPDMWAMYIHLDHFMVSETMNFFICLKYLEEQSFSRAGSFFESQDPSPPTRTAETETDLK